RRLAARPGGRASLRREARERRRRDLPGQPAAPPADPRRGRVHAVASLLRPGPDGPAVADQLGAEDRSADVPGQRVPGRADRRRLRVDALAPPEAPRREDHRHERRPHQLARSDDPVELARVPGPIRRRTGARSEPSRPDRAAHLPADPRRERPDPAASSRPLRRRYRLPGGEAPLRGGPARPRAHGERRWLADRRATGPDVPEAYVQNGWLRASHRKLDRKTSTVLAPRPTHLERDASPLPAGAFTKVRVGLFSVAHAFRAGSRIRISIEAPGGDRTRWAFDTAATHGGVL